MSPVIAPAEPTPTVEPIAPHPVSARATNPPAPPGNARWLVGLAVALGVGIAAGFAIARREAGEAPAPATSTEGEKDKLPEGTVQFSHDRWAAAGIVTERVTTGELRDRVWRTGTVQLDEDKVAHIDCPVDGVVREVKAHLGSNVKADQVLAVIDSREVGRAKLELMTTRLGLAAAATQNDWTKRVTTNAKELWKELEANRPIAEIEQRFRDRPTGEWWEKLLTAYSQVIQLRARYADLSRADRASVPESTLRSARSDAETAEARYRAMIEEARFQMTQQGITAEQKYREAKAAADTAVAQLLMIGFDRPEIDKMDPAAEGASVSLLEIRAPFAGTVYDKHAVTGERVVAQHQLFAVSDLSEVWVKADIFETDLPLVRELAGKPLAFRAPAAGLPERPAKLHYLGEVIDPATRALPLVASADNADRVLKPGMFVEVGLIRHTTGPVLSVPAAAIQRHENRTFVFVAAGDDAFRRADIAIGDTLDGRTVVTAGLNPGDRVVTDGAFVLKTELLKDQIAGE